MTDAHVLIVNNALLLLIQLLSHLQKRPPFSVKQRALLCLLHRVVCRLYLFRGRLARWRGIVVHLIAGFYVPLTEPELLGSRLWKALERVPYQLEPGLLDGRIAAARLVSGSSSARIDGVASSRIPPIASAIRPRGIDGSTKTIAPVTCGS